MCPTNKKGSRQRSVSKNPVEEEGLLVTILASLPLLKIFDLRRVCKLWNSALRSPSFWKAWLARHESCSFCAPWLVMARKPVGAPAFAREHATFDSATGAWISLEALLRTSCSEAALKDVCTRFPYSFPARFMEEMVWIEMIVIRHKGQLLTARALFDTKTSLAGFEVWALHPACTCPSPGDTVKQVEVADWVKVTQTPRRLWEGFFEREPGDEAPFDIKIIYFGSLICMTACLHGTKYFVPLVYDLDRDFWYHLPPYKSHYEVAAAFGMRPWMAAVAQQGMVLEKKEEMARLK